MKLTAGQRNYLVYHQFVPSVLINFVLNAGFGWIFFQTQPVVPLLSPLSIDIKPNSISLDLVPMIFFLTFFTALIVSRQTRGALDAGRLEPARIDHSLFHHYVLHCYPESFRLAALLTLILAPTTAAAMYWHEIHELSLWDFVWFKAIYATVLAALFTPFVVLSSMARYHS